MHDLAQDLKHVLLGDKAGQGVVMSDNSRKVYDRVLEHSSRPLDEIADILQFSMINFASSVTGEHSPPFSLFLPFFAATDYSNSSCPSPFLSLRKGSRLLPST